MENNKNVPASIGGRIKKNWVKLLVGLVLILIAGAFIWGKFFTSAASGQYVLGQVVRGDLVTKVKGTGQVSAYSQVDLKPQGSTQSSAVINEVDVKQGDKVVAGQLIASIENRSALTALHQAQANLKNSQASYDKLIAGPTSYEIKLSEDSVTQAEQSYKDAQTELDNTKSSTAQAVSQAQQTLDDVEALSNTKRDSVINAVVDALASVKSAMATENTIILDQNLSGVFAAKNSGLLQSMKDTLSQATSLVSTAGASLATAKTNENDANLDQASGDMLSALRTAQSSANYCYSALQSSSVGSQFSQSQLDSYISSVNSQLDRLSSSISSVQTARQNLKDAITSAQNGLVNAQSSAKSQLASAESSVQSSYNSWQSDIDSLNKLKAPARQEDIASAQADLANVKAALESAQYTYDQNFLRSPFDGVVAQVDVSKGDQANTNTVVATIITSELYAEISLNELDAAQTKTGASATVKFDALPGTLIQGKVVQIDTIGSINQGVVSYNAKVSLDGPSSDVKPGMSVTVSIVTNTEKDQLLVPNSAIKTNGNVSTVEVPDSASVASAKPGDTVTLVKAPQSVNVEIGDTDNVQTVIKSGLKENQIIVTRQITGTAAKSSGGLFTSPQ
jgi:HlyD family secretion protein